MAELTAVYNVEAVRGDTLRYFVDFFEDELKTTPYDLTQWSEFLLQVKVNATDETNQIELTLAAGLTVSGTNRMSFEFLKTQMEIPSRPYVYDLEGQNDPGDRETVLQGRFDILTDVSRKTTP